MFKQHEKELSAFVCEIVTKFDSFWTILKVYNFAIYRYYFINPLISSLKILIVWFIMFRTKASPWLSCIHAPKYIYFHYFIAIVTLKKEVIYNMEYYKYYW